VRPMSPPSTRARLTSAALAIGLLTAPSASAHLVNSGVGPFYDGIAHLFLTVEDLVLVIALGLLGALAGKPAARGLVLALPPAWLAGALAGRQITLTLALDFVPAIGILAIGLLVAIDPRLPAPAPALLAMVLGLLHGFLNGRAMAGTATPFPAALGIVAAVATVCLPVAALGVSLQQPSQRIALRVLGSWAAAIGLLSLAWQVRPPA